MSENKKKQQSFEYGAMILLISTALVKLIGFAFKIPVSVLLGDLGFGYFSSAYDLFLPIYTLSMAGLPIAVSRIVAQNMAKQRYSDVRQSLSATKKLFAVTGFAGTALMIYLIPKFVQLTDKTGRTIYSLYAIVPAIIFCCIMSTYRGYYEGLRNMYPTAISDVTEATGKLVLGYGFAYITIKLTDNVAYGAAAAMLGITVGSGIAALYLWLRYKIKGDGITKRELAASPQCELESDTVKTLIVIAIPVVMTSLANSVASLVDVSMVKWQLSNLMGSFSGLIRGMYAESIADYNLINPLKTLKNDELPTFLYGVRSKAFTIYNLVPQITSVLGVSALPVLATSWTLADKKLIKRDIESTIKMTALIAMPAGMGFLFLGDEIMALLYNTVASVEIGGPMMRIYGIAALFAGMAIPMTSMLQAIGRQFRSLRNVIIGAILKLVVNYTLVAIPTVNIMGAAIGTCVCYMFVFIANLLTLIKFSGTVPNIYKTIIKPFIAAIACGVTAFAVSSIVSGRIGTILAIASAAVVYFITLIIFNTFEEKDLLALPKGEKLLCLAKKVKIIR